MHSELYWDQLALRDDAGHGPLVISIDQCFLWNFINPKADKRFAELRQKLLAACSEGRIICPAPDELLFENIELDGHQRDAAIELQNRLACGRAFRSFEQLVAFETLAMLRPFLYARFLYGPTQLRTDADLKEIRNGHTRFKEQEESKGLVDRPPGYERGMGLRQIFDWIIEKRAGQMYRIVRAFLEHQPFVAHPNDWDRLTSVGDIVMGQRLSRPEALALESKILNREWEKIGILAFHTLIDSRRWHDRAESGRILKLNDEIDILRAVVAFEQANVLTCDHKMKALLNQVGCLKDGVEVFSAREPDLLSGFIDGSTGTGTDSFNNSFP